MIRTKNVTINKKRTNINYRLQEGDQLELYGTEDSSPSINLDKLHPLDVVYEDEAVIIVNKPIGITVQADKYNSFMNMNNQLLKHMNWKEKNRKNLWKPAFVHRLDRNTSGLLIGAKTYSAYLELSKAMKEGKVNKYYETLVNGMVPFKKRIVKDYLLKDSANNKVTSVNKGTPGSKEAISEIRLIRHFPNSKETLLEIKLITGRTHQIRVHLSNLGFPIRGDQKYWKEKDKKTYPHTRLVAKRIEFGKDLEGTSIEHLAGKVFSLKKT